VIALACAIAAAAMAKLADLPNEIVLIVLSQLVPEDLCAVSCVNKHLSVISSDNFLWERFCCGIPKSLPTGKNDD